MRSGALIFACSWALAGVREASAQDDVTKRDVPADTTQPRACFRSARLPRCRSFVQLEARVSRGFGVSPKQRWDDMIALNAGFMKNRDARTAVGAVAVFSHIDRAYPGFHAVELRYRKWGDRGGAFKELALGPAWVTVLPVHGTQRLRGITGGVDFWLNPYVGLNTRAFVLNEDGGRVRPALFAGGQFGSTAVPGVMVVAGLGFLLVLIVGPPSN